MENFFNFFANYFVTGFSVWGVGLAVLLICLSLIFLIIGIITHESYANNKISYITCRLFVIFIMIAWVVLQIVFIVEFFANIICLFSGDISVRHFVSIFVFFALIFLFIEIAIRVFGDDGRYVGHVTPYDHFLRFRKPLYWKD